ncbi:hypothetical protein FK529_04690 [Tsukamurella asaccharolytica]|uniref:Uncharacterized protein n=1 Tax=Tsukamurella asaccharolytica TaxID=2592067 RepID=A0A5C5RDL0_9ACTN|nr:hypothetical protein [Tsukamurella asaccharolytica]TWS20644.1 hypothetical protein FK529_04690 [Tsukamurella asaccharolytica]
MTTDHRYRARDAVATFDRLGIALPDPVLDAVAALDQVDAARPEQPDPGAVAQLIADGAPAKTVTAALEASALHGAHLSAWQQARQITGRRVTTAILDHASELHAALAEQADTAIAILEADAHIDKPLAELVRTGETDAARTVAGADHAAELLDSLGTVRDLWLKPLGSTHDASGVNCGTWRDPRALDGRLHGATTPREVFRMGIRAGGQLWFPTVDEARAAAEKIATQLRAKAEAEAAATRGAGGLTSF